MKCKRKVSKNEMYNKNENLIIRETKAKKKKTYKNIYNRVS